jgi:hypothetical protein
MTEPTTNNGTNWLSRQLRKECVLREGEEFDAWAARNKWLPLPVFIFQTVYEAILDFARTSNEKNLVRNGRLDDLERRCAELESRAAIKYCGIYRPDGVYQEGNLVTLRGGLWIATKQTAAKPGGDDSGWRLVVKEGRG